MFTGIVQAMGTVRSIQRGPGGVLRLLLDAPDLPRPIPLGASIAVSGVCLTVTHVDTASLAFDVIPETVSRSTLGWLATGARVNLERSLRAGDAMDGHIVQGHVDGLAAVVDVQSGPDGHVVTFEVADDLLPYVIPKGSIAIDGVSLTIASVEANTFSVALIPTTLRMTSLGGLRPGDQVNIETDILVRTVVTTLQRWGASRPAPELAPSREPLTIDMLREQGWA